MALATHNTWFGGIYQDPSNFFAQIARRAEGVPRRSIREFPLPPDQMAAWMADRQGAVVGADLATRFGWKIGDRIPHLRHDLAAEGRGRSGTSTSPASTTASAASTRRSFFFRYDYLDENRRQGSGQVGWYIVKIADPSQAQEMGAKFDEMFANSSAETKTTTEKGFVEGFAKQIGDIGAIMIAIVAAVLFTMLLVAANTMAQSVRERTSEVGVLKTLGFSNARDSRAACSASRCSSRSSAAGSGCCRLG